MSFEPPSPTPGNDSAIKRDALVAVIAVAGLVALGCLLWRTPLKEVRAKASVGQLNLDDPMAKLSLRLNPPKALSSITIVFPKPMDGSQELCTQPKFPLSLRARLTGPDGIVLFDEVVTSERMQWTSWHNNPSLLLGVHGWFSHRMDASKEYDLSVSVEKPVGGLGQVEVFLHWADGSYIWGVDKQPLKFTRLSSE